MENKSDKKLTKEEIREILRKPKMKAVIHQMANEILIRQWENERKDNSHIDKSL